MHIAIDAREFTPKGRTGIGRYLENLLNPLLKRPDLQFTLFLEPDGVVPESLKTNSIQFVRLPHLPAQINDQLVIPVLAAKENADIFFSPYYKTCFSGKFKRIITVHDVMFLHNKSVSPLKMWLIKKQLNMATQKADIILTDSHYTAEELKAIVSGITEKIFCLYPDLSAEWFEEVPENKAESVVETYHIKNPYFLYTGNFKPHKKVDELLYGFALALKDKKKFKYDLVLAGGDTQNEERIKKLIHTLKLETKIHLLNKIGDEELRALYKKAKWCITASSYEGFGYIVPEAFASNTPLICRDTTSLGEITAGWMIKLKDSTPQAIYEAIQEAVALPEAVRRELISNARKRAETFAPGSAASRFLEIITKLNCQN
jgi:glycosyltransferase involved in cell wall biosynthesis